MKVIIATLLIVGLAAALPTPKSIIKNLKEQLKQDVQDIKTHTKQVVEQVSAHAKEDIDAVVKNPFTGLKKVIENLSNDARTVVGTTVSDVNNVNDHIQAAINALSQVDVGPVKEILDNLKQQLKGDVKDAKASAQQLLKQALGHIADDFKALLTDSANADKIIQDNWNTDLNDLIREGKKYTDTVQQQIQEALDKINKQLDQ